MITPFHERPTTKGRAGSAQTALVRMVTNNKFRAMPTCVAILLSMLLSILFSILLFMTRVAAAQTDWSGE